MWLAKLSIISFQRWFPDAKFILFYNGYDFDEFKNVFEKIDPHLISPVEHIDQIAKLGDGTLVNPYHNYFPFGVWWKWVPFRWDISCDEISIDTDIVCVNEPKSWFKWIDGNDPIIVAPERFSKILVNTCGDFARHPILHGRKPLNCGVVGQRAGHDYAKRFFEVTEEIDFGRTQNSLFITEQGAVNLWIYSLEQEGIKHYTLDFEKNAWVRDFVYFIEKGVRVETIHATTWHKRVVTGLRNPFEKKVLEDGYDDTAFLSDLVEGAGDLDEFGSYLVKRQLGTSEDSGTEFYFLG